MVLGMDKMKTEMEAMSMEEDNEKKSVEVQVVTSHEQMMQNVYNIVDRTFAYSRKEQRTRVILGLSGDIMMNTMADVLPFVRDEFLNVARFVFCDERRVPFDDPESTFGQYRRQVLPRLRSLVSEEQFLTINPILPVDECAADYEMNLRALVDIDAEWPVLDVAFVGLGPDGHTCSLFPGHPAVQENWRWVAAVKDSPKSPAERVTLTLPVLSHARHVVFVVTGAAKADVVKDILEGDEPTKAKYPAGLIMLIRRFTRVHWILDQAAASKLTQMA